LPYSILIVDDNPVIRKSLRRLVEQDPAWTVCGEAENGQLAVDKVSQLTPDLVILDLQMPVMGGIEAARRITLASPKTMIVMFTMHSCAQVEKDAHAAGVAHVLVQGRRGRPSARNPEKCFGYTYDLALNAIGLNELATASELIIRQTCDNPQAEGRSTGR
jgi:CheY-like chemotaxis protein